MSSENENRVGIEEARGRLGSLVTAAQQGQTIVITRNGRPAAQIIPYQEDSMSQIDIHSLPAGWTYDPQPLSVTPAIEEHWNTIAPELDRLLLHELAQVLASGDPDHIIISTALSVLQRYSARREWHRLSDDTHPHSDAAQAITAAISDAIAGRVDDSDAVQRLRVAVGD